MLLSLVVLVLCCCLVLVVLCVSCYEVCLCSLSILGDGCLLFVCVFVLSMFAVAVVYGLNPWIFWLGLSVLLAYRLLGCIYC